MHPLFHRSLSASLYLLLPSLFFFSRQPAISMRIHTSKLLHTRQNCSELLHDIASADSPRCRALLPPFTKLNASMPPPSSKVCTGRRMPQIQPPTPPPGCLQLCDICMAKIHLPAPAGRRPQGRALFLHHAPAAWTDVHAGLWTLLTIACYKDMCRLCS